MMEVERVPELLREMGVPDRGQKAGGAGNPQAHPGGPLSSTGTGMKFLVEPSSGRTPTEGVHPSQP